MSEPAQDVEVRLAEIDRRLREIQAELVPGRVPRETQVRPHVRAADSPPHPALGPPSFSAEPPAPERPRGRAGPLAEALQRARSARAMESSPSQGHRRQADQFPPGPLPELRRSSRPAPQGGSQIELLSQLQSSLLAATRDLLEGYERAVSTAAGSDLQLTVAAGPFASTDVLHAFERELSRIPGVRGVSVSGYEGRHHAILEVRLGQEPGAAASPEPSP